MYHNKRDEYKFKLFYMSFSFSFDEFEKEASPPFASTEFDIDNDKIFQSYVSESGELTFGRGYDESCRAQCVDVNISEVIKFKMSIYNDQDYGKYDIVKGKYEGGGKVWECSIDLCKYITSALTCSTSGSSKSCLELGCGHGFPGITALELGYNVFFTDFNKDVLPHTYNNVCYNRGSNKMTCARFFYGDWLSLSNTVLQSTYDKFDLLLSAETLYSLDACRKVWVMIQRHLSADLGLALIASKKYYFGVGGGTHELELLVHEHNSSIEMKKRKTPTESCIRYSYTFNVVQSICDGQSNVREIIQIKKFKT